MGIVPTEYRLSLDQSGAALGASWVLPSGTTERFVIAPTLTAEDLAEHRWYLEEYILFPGPGDHARARAFEQRLEAFGQALHGRSITMASMCSAISLRLPSRGC